MTRSITIEHDKQLFTFAATRNDPLTTMDIFRQGATGGDTFRLVQIGEDSSERHIHPERYWAGLQEKDRKAVLIKLRQEMKKMFGD